jgi:transposase-like protein
VFNKVTLCLTGERYYLTKKHQLNVAMRLTYVSPRSVRLFEDSAACLAMIDDLRWAHGHTCPRCSSTSVRPRTEPTQSQSYVCLDCDYTFNAAAGTIFMGARLPITSYVQAFTIHDALGDSASYKEISFAIESSDRATKGVMQRVKSVNVGIRFTVIDAALARSLRNNDAEHRGSRGQNFFGFCDAKSILIDETELIRFLGAVSNIPMPDLVLSYGRRGRSRAERAGSIDSKE